MKTFGLYVTSRPRAASRAARASAISSSSGLVRSSTGGSYVPGSGAHPFGQPRPLYLRNPERGGMQMNGWNRAVLTLAAAGVAGFLLWLAAQFDMHTTGGYWAALGVVAGCGLLLGLAQLRGAGGNPPAMLALGLLPVAICAGWAIVYAEPHGNWFRHHVT